MAHGRYQPIVGRDTNNTRNAANFSPEVGQAFQHPLIPAKIRRNDSDRILKQVYPGSFQTRFLGARHRVARYIEAATGKDFRKTPENRAFDTGDVGYNRGWSYERRQTIGHGRYRGNRRSDKD